MTPARLRILQFMSSHTVDQLAHELNWFAKVGASFPVLCARRSIRSSGEAWNLALSAAAEKLPDVARGCFGTCKQVAYTGCCDLILVKT